LRRVGGGHSVRHHHRFHAVHVKAVGDAAGNGVGGEVGLVDLRTAGEVGGEQSSAGAAAEVAGEVGEAGDLIGFAERNADVVGLPCRGFGRRQPS
jgi:hypothetical protein